MFTIRSHGLWNMFLSSVQKRGAEGPESCRSATVELSVMGEINHTESCCCRKTISGDDDDEKTRSNHVKSGCTVPLRTSCTSVLL